LREVKKKQELCSARNAFGREREKGEAMHLYYKPSSHRYDKKIH